MVGIEWNVLETESPRSVRCSRSIKGADWIVNLNSCVRNDGAGGVQYSTANGCRVGLCARTKGQKDIEKRYKSRMNRLLIRSKHEVLRKISGSVVKDECETASEARPMAEDECGERVLK